MMNNEVDVYVDDVMIDSETREGHFQALDKFLGRVGRYHLRLNSKKSVFRVTSRKLLGHIVNQRGIKIDLDKVKAIQEMPMLKMKREAKGFLQRLQYINRFISKLIMDEHCQKAFNRIKEYLMKSPVLKPLRDGKPLILYLALEEEAIGEMVAQCRPNDVEHAVCYLSKKLLPYESNYNLMKKTCLAMIWATRKLRHYFQCYRIQAILKIDLLKYLFKAPSFRGKLTRWLVFLIEFDIDYVTKKMVKGRAVVEFLAQNANKGDDPWDLNLLDENFRAIEIQKWKMYYDGAVNAKGAGLGVVLITLKGEILPMAKRLDFRVTNNMVEYKAYLFRLEATMVARVEQLMVYGDSMLVIQQALEEKEVKEERLKLYVNYLRTLGINIIGEIKPPSNSHKSIVVVIDYFFKWFKAKSFTNVGARQMARFIERNLICKYGVPHHAVTNNEVQFMGETAKLLVEYKIEYHRSSPYNPKSNGAVEATNKNLNKILLKMV
ncbi:uncharacterized protein LOC125369931 [Ricinus communis]|uniref:uncharacterized protein LOC125369931 n=1 Tax=Ricinus communis TaxID=3988 RepID=UPI00201B050A|nr:uncharacterized protein LOC125369931 [Ricinus communis]